MKTFAEYTIVEEDMKNVLGSLGAAALMATAPLSDAQGATRPNTELVSRVGVTNDFLSELKKLEGDIPYQTAIHTFRNGKFYPYKDSLGKLTIGYGHLILNGENFTNGITEREANGLLVKDAQIAIDETNKLLVNYQITPDAAQIIGNMVYQMGPSRVKKFKNMWRALKHQDYQKAALEMVDSEWHKQTPERAKLLANRMTRAFGNGSSSADIRITKKGKS